MLYLSGKVRPGLPAMVTPRMYQLPPEGVRWAADTGCYARPQDHDDGRYLAWLERVQEVAGPPLFATAPDRYGDGPATLALALPMLPRIRETGAPAALVAQPGTTSRTVPWAAIDALFLGGPDAWKHGEDAYALAQEARARGLWVHMGRVNSWSRYELARSFGCHSVDGTVLRFDPSRPVEEWPRRAAARPQLW